MKTVFVTGSSGFIGSSLIPILVHHYNVICISRQELIDMNYLKWQLPKADVIIHLAAIKYNHQQVQRISDVNVEITRNLLRFTRSHTQFIYISTWLATFTDKAGLYGSTKRKAEEIIKTKSRNFSILRLPHVYSSNPIHKFFTIHVLPIYLNLRYHLKPFLEPLMVFEIAKSISLAINNRKLHNQIVFIEKGPKFTSISLYI